MPPVAMVRARSRSGVSWPLSTSTMRSTSPPNPYRAPEWMALTVVVPMGWSGVTSMSSRGSLAVRVASASSEMPMPGWMVPPT